MRIACPSCNAVYQVPTEQLGEGRVVRCVRCGTDWSPVVEVPVVEVPVVDVPVNEMPVDEGAAAAKAVERPVEALPEPALDEPAAPVRRMALDEDGAATVVVAPGAAEARARRRGLMWLAIAWVVSVAVVIGAVAAAVVGRETVMQVWPPSIRAYSAVGLAAKP